MDKKIHINGIIGWIALVLVGIGFLGFVIRLVFFPAHIINKGLETGTGIVDKTLNADNAIYNYEYFKKQKESIDAYKLNLENAKEQARQFRSNAGERTNWTFEDKNEDSRLSSVVTGIANTINDMVADYNAKSKMANRNIFKDGLIPEIMERVAGLIN